MPRPRNKENAGLPRRWQAKHGAYYYQVPVGLEHLWQGKKLYRLGGNLAEAYKTWAVHLASNIAIKTVTDLLDRYSLEVVPTKAKSSQNTNPVFIAKLKQVFGEMALPDIKPRHVYAYVDKRTAKTSALREVEVLRHAYTKAVEWGYLDAHPFKGEIRLTHAAPRDRFVEDWEISEMLSLASKRRKGSVDMVKAYIKLKILTGLRRGDLLRLKMSDIKDDGIHVQPSKTKHSSGKRAIFAFTNEQGESNGRREAIDEALASRPCISPYLFCKRDGACYIDEKDDMCHGWDSLWQRFVDRVLAETKITERFTEHDLRAKAGSDAPSLERAQQLLTHASSATTKKIYRRKPEIIR